MQQIKSLFIIGWAILVGMPVASQLPKRSNFEYIKKEIQRGYDSLRIGEHKPFIISALLTEKNSLSIAADRGVFAHSRWEPSVNRVLFRMLIGDYHQTNIDYSMLTPDKKRTSDYQMNPPAFRSRLQWVTQDEGNETAVRVLTWKVLDDLFKRAVAEYVKKQDGMKHGNFDPTELSVPDWATPLPLKKEFVDTETPTQIDRKKYEQYVGALSEVFKSYPNLEYGSVNLSLNQGVERYFSTEGIETSRQFEQLSLSLSASVKLKNGAALQDEYQEEFPAIELPPIEQMTIKAKAIAERLSATPDMEVFNDLYDGPILFLGEAVQSIVSRHLLLNGSRGVAPERQPLGSLSTGPDYFIGKQLYSKTLTLKDLAGTRFYKGKALAGYFPVDEDGIQPPKELLLIEKGVLRNLLVGRMPLKYAQQSNGHSRMNRSVWGTLQMSVSGAKPYEKLKKEFVRQGRKSGQEYVYIVTKVSWNNADWLIRINTKTGEETMLRNALLEELRPSSFKQILGASTEEYILGTLQNNNETGESVPVSYILPQALILDNLQLLKAKPQTPVKEPLVPKPER